LSREYEILTENDFDLMVARFKSHFMARKDAGQKFQKLRITAKRWQKAKSSSQHRAYWRCINVLKDNFLELGYVFNQDQIHEYIKRVSGFTETKEMPDGTTIMVCKSIADKSDDATARNLQFLIDFMIQFSIEKLNMPIDIGGVYQH